MKNQKLTFNETTYEFVVNHISDETYFNGDIITTEKGVIIVNNLQSIPFECFYDKNSENAFYKILSNGGQFGEINGKKGLPFEVVLQLISQLDLEMSK